MGSRMIPSKSIKPPAYSVSSINKETIAQGWSSWMRSYEKKKKKKKK